MRKLDIGAVANVVNSFSREGYKAIPDGRKELYITINQAHPERDDVINLWSGDAKKRIQQPHIASIRYNPIFNGLVFEQNSSELPESVISDLEAIAKAIEDKVPMDEPLIYLNGGKY